MASLPKPLEALVVELNRLPGIGPRSAERLALHLIQAETAVAKRLADQQLTMEISDDAKRHLAKAGYDPQFGARPLQRAIQRLIENPLAEALLAGDVIPGDTIEATMSGSELRFEKSPALLDAA